MKRLSCPFLGVITAPCIFIVLTGSAFAATRSVGQVAEEELRVTSKPSSSPKPAGLSEIQAPKIADIEAISPKDWTLGMSLQRFSPVGTLRIVTGDRYSLEAIGPQAMIGLEICRAWNKGSGSRLIYRSCLNGLASSRSIDLQTSNGYRIENARLSHFSSNLSSSAETPLIPAHHLLAQAEGGLGYLGVSQSSPNSTGNASGGVPYFLVGPAIRWAPTQEFFAKLGYQYWGGLNRTDTLAVPRHHYLLTGGFAF